MASNSKVLLSSIQTLTFFDGEKTTYRRTSPVDQLVCKGVGCKIFRPDVIQCYNKGGSGTDINWKCEADLPSSLKLGRVEVGCEGWSNSNDPYVLKGSCGLTYTLKIASSSTYDSRSSGGITNSAWFFWTIFFAVALFILYPFLRSLLVMVLPSLDPILPGSTGGGGGGGGGGPGGGARPRFWGGGRPSDPPPPYTPRPPPKSTNTTSEQPWRPGFWTGLAAGTAATHLFGNRERRPQWYETGWNNPFTATSSTDFGTGGWFGGSPSVGRSHPTYRGQGSSRDVDDGNLGPIRSATGFGGTRNR